MKLRTIVLLSLFAAFAVGLMAVAQEPVTIEFWHRFSSRHESTLETLKAEFEAIYPHITVEFIYQGSYGDLQSKINNGIVAGTTPTMTIFYENWIPPVADAILPLDDLLSQEVKDDIITGLMSTAVYDGKLLTVPFNKSIMVFYYIEDLVPTPPTTWDEFLQMCKDLTVDTDGDGVMDRYGTGLRPASNPEQFLTLLNQNDGAILNEDWSEVVLGNEAGLEAAEFYVELSQYAWVTSEYLNSNINLLAMAIDTSAGYYYWNNAADDAGLTLKLARVPGKNNQSSMIQGTNIGVFADATDAEKDAAVKFIEFLLQGDKTAYWAVRSGYMPVTYSGYESQVWLDHIDANPYAVVMSDQMLDGFSQILHPNYGDMRYALSTFCEEITLGGLAVADALEAAIDEIEMLLE